MTTEITMKEVHDWLENVGLEMYGIIGFSWQPSPLGICVADGKYVKYIDACSAHGVHCIGVK